MPARDGVGTNSPTQHTLATELGQLTYALQIVTDCLQLANCLFKQGRRQCSAHQYVYIYNYTYIYIYMAIYMAI